MVKRERRETGSPSFAKGGSGQGRGEEHALKQISDTLKVRRKSLQSERMAAFALVEENGKRELSSRALSPSHHHLVSSF